MSCSQSDQFPSHWAASLGALAGTRHVWVLWAWTRSGECSRLGFHTAARALARTFETRTRKYLEGHVADVAGGDYQKSDMSNRLTVQLMVPGENDPMEAFVALMEPGMRGEYWEACAVTPSDKYLLGGFPIQRVAASAPQYVSNRGFASALDVLRWWARTTSDAGRFQRFLCWVALGDQGELEHCWDRNGTYYPPARYEEIRNRGLDLPVP